MKTSNLLVFTVVSVVEQIFVQTSLTEPVDIVEDYNVSMTNTGPAFYGSNLTFSAELVFGTGQVPKDTSYFRYEWQSSADHLRESQNADFKTSLTRCYSLIKPGTYSMSLKVFNEKLLKREMVAHTTKIFTITDNVNGKLTGTQKGMNKTDTMIFSTQKPIEIKLNVTDRFMDDPEFTYKWYLNGENETFVNKTSSSHQFSINETGFHEVKVKVYSQETVLGCDGFSDTQPSGEFQTDIMLYDPIGAVQIVGKNIVKNNSYIMEVIYFNGSSPFNISWSFMNVSSGGIISSGHKDMVESSPVTVELRRHLVIGQYYFTATVENPVSKRVRQHNFTVTYNKGPSHSAAVVVLPLLGGLALMTLIIIVIVYVAVPRWKGRHVETADFDFHPTLRLPSNTEETGTFSSFKFTLQRLFGKEDKKSVHNTRVKNMLNYGSLDSSVVT